MTPKEKAEEITAKYMPLVKTWDCYNDVPIPYKQVLVDAKKCALICVDEISMCLWGMAGEGIPTGHSIENFHYWQEVKQEIEKL